MLASRGRSEKHWNLLQNASCIESHADADGRPADEPIERVRGSGSEGSADEESENTSVLDKYRKILRDADSEAATKAEGNFFAKMMASAKIKACETDFDCNPVRLFSFLSSV